ncbi:FliM/FliN family flagellar motor switch protein [Oceanisphaera sp. W20_SRM_FM3]|uniref:FliM/FliN family flagellar motor switch protein n=1 Tax=Oceanisphaera sp. W20_SRM_FM3 TaxID=3240267 RepID=UPI003F969982
MAVNKQPQRAMGLLSGKVHPVGAEVEFPRYDFFQQEDLLLRQSQQLAASLETNLRNWQARLESMFYRAELTLTCELVESNTAAEGRLCFVLEGNDLSGALLADKQPLAWLFIEQASLYQLAEMSFGGEPNPARTLGQRTLSETERRLGANLLTLLANELLAQLLLSSSASRGLSTDLSAHLSTDQSINLASSRRVLLAPAPPNLTTVTWLSFNLSCGEHHLNWQLAMPVLLQTPAPAIVEAQLSAALSQALNQALKARLPQLSTRLTVPLAEFDLPLGQLALLQVGDILPIHLLQETRARVGQQPVLKGRVAEQQGRLVFASHGFVE